MKFLAFTLLISCLNSYASAYLELKKLVGEYKLKSSQKECPRTLDISYRQGVLSVLDSSQHQLPGIAGGDLGANEITVFEHINQDPIIKDLGGMVIKTNTWTNSKGIFFIKKT